MGLVTDIGHIVVPVKDMDASLRFYRDLLGFSVVGEVTSVWTVIEVPGGRLTLYRQESAPALALGENGDATILSLHVANFEEVADLLVSKGVKVKRDGTSGGVAWDPYGNVIGLHDHRE